MNTKNIYFKLILVCSCWFSYIQAFSCSMYKITIDKTTMVGSNYDAYYTNPQIWLEHATTTNTYGAIFSGGRKDPKFGYSPQSGMNEVGLCFSRLAALTSNKKLSNASNKKTINNQVEYLKNSIHLCKNIEEVKLYIDQYNHQVFIEDVFIYIDQSGKYLIVEPDTTYFGNENNYILSNFCPSQTKEEDALKLERYKNGVNFLHQQVDSSFDFCKKLSDTMHVCRAKMGDGTLLTTIYDLQKGLIKYYFYHDFNQVVSFNLKDELAKSDTSYHVVDLFPPNKEFEKYLHYKTPDNYRWVMYAMFIFSIIFFILMTLILYLIFKKQIAIRQHKIVLLILGFDLLLSLYLITLIKKTYIYYFPAPYKDYHFSIHTIFAYIPFLLAFSILPILYYTIRIILQKQYAIIVRSLFTIQLILFLFSMLIFFYWGLYSS